MPKPEAGRPRDPGIDAAILSVARRHLAERGYEGLSVSAVASEAGTTRQALYRRHPSKADLATAAIAAMRRDEDAPPGGTLADLTGELEAFRRGISRPDGISMVGTMLQRTTDPQLLALFRRRVVAPRRRRLRAILIAARDAGALDADADIDIGVSMLTGSWYAFALAGTRPPADWAQRVTRAVWRALGGQV